jgi:hypothetical protein
MEPIQLVYFLLGVAIAGVSLRRLRTMMPPVSPSPPAHSHG